MDLNQAVTELEHLVDGMAETVNRKATIAVTEVTELRRRVAVVRDALPGTVEVKLDASAVHAAIDEATKPKLAAKPKSGPLNTEHAPE